ncbi:MAG: hypothetical protein ACYCPQ_01365 [Elusimicrobiota bacterium]
MKGTQSGSVLLQVVVMGIIVAFLAASMAAILLRRYYASSRLQNENQNTRMAEGGWMSLISGWNPLSGGHVCQGNSQYSCVSASGSGGCSPGCPTLSYCGNCVCTPNAGLAGYPVIYAYANNFHCGVNYSIEVITPP